MLGDGAVLSLDVEDPDLATGEPGSGIDEVRWWVGSRSYTHPLTRVKGTVDASSGTVEINTNLTAAASTSGEGARRVNVQVRDGATPVNATSTSFSFIRDTKPPTFTLSRTQGDISPQSATAVTVSVGGTISDANVIRSAELQLRRVNAGQTCATADTLPRREDGNTRVSRNRVDLENDTNAITFDETFTIRRNGTGAGTENLCFYLDSEDIAVEPNGRDAGNPGDYVLNEFAVSWPDGRPPPGPTFMFQTADDNTNPTTFTDADSLQVAEGTAAGDGMGYWVRLTNVATAPTATAPLSVTVSAPPGSGMTVTPATLSLTSETDSALVTVTTGHDLDLMSELHMLSHTATGYDAASFPVRVLDDDFALSTSVMSVTEDADSATVIITATAGTAPADAAGTALAVTSSGIGGATGDDFRVTSDGDW